MSETETPRVGDMVTLRGPGRDAIHGWVFDIIGDVARIWITAGAGMDRDQDVEELMPIKTSELIFAKRLPAYASVRFTGSTAVQPYAFVVTGPRHNVLSAVDIFERATNYEIVQTNVHDDNDEMKDGINDGTDTV